MTRTREGLSRVSLAVALLAAGALLAGALPEQNAPAPVRASRPTVAQAWPDAARADLRDLGMDPLLFLDATTPVGTVETPDGKFLRLVVGYPAPSGGDEAGAVQRDGGGRIDGARQPGGDGQRGERVRELRRLPSDARFDNVTATGDELLWTETAEDGHTEIWAANLRAGAAPRRLTAQTGNILLYGNQHDLVIADGRVHWAAADGDDATEIRSVALSGGAVRTRVENGQWALSAWPWLTDDVGGPAGEIRLRNFVTGTEHRIAAGPAEWTMCTPAWCRVMVHSGDGPARIDLMRPDGTDRRRVAGSGTQAAVNDVAVLDRFEVLSEPRPDTDLTGTAGLIVHDVRTGTTVSLAVAADLAATRDGMLWWSTGDREATVWHTLDLRTI